MNEIENLFAELSTLIRAHGISNSPMMDNREWYVLKKRCEFEPHGRASETWETIWYLELPWCNHYWRSTTGWRAGNPVVHAVIKGRTLKVTLERAIAFLKETREQGIVLGENIHEEKPRIQTQDSKKV